MNLTIAEFQSQAEAQIRQFVEQMENLPPLDTITRTRIEAIRTAVLAEHDQFAAHLVDTGLRSFAEPTQPQALKTARIVDPYAKAFQIFLFTKAINQREVKTMCPHAWDDARVVLCLLGPRWMGCQSCLPSATPHFPTEDDQLCDFCQLPLEYSRMITVQAGNITMIGDYCDRCAPTLAQILDIPASGS